jgi:hypothetical protein
LIIPPEIIPVGEGPVGGPIEACDRGTDLGFQCVQVAPVPGGGKTRIGAGTDPSTGR